MEKCPSGSQKNAPENFSSSVRESLLLSEYFFRAHSESFYAEIFANEWRRKTHALKNYERVRVKNKLRVKRKIPAWNGPGHPFVKSDGRWKNFQVFFLNFVK